MPLCSLVETETPDTWQKTGCAGMNHAHALRPMAQAEPKSRARDLIPVSAQPTRPSSPGSHGQASGVVESRRARATTRAQTNSGQHSIVQDPTEDQDLDRARPRFPCSNPPSTPLGSTSHRSIPQSTLYLPPAPAPVITAMQPLV